MVGRNLGEVAVGGGGGGGGGEDGLLALLVEHLDHHVDDGGHALQQRGVARRHEREQPRAHEAALARQHEVVHVVDAAVHPHRRRRDVGVVLPARQPARGRLLERREEARRVVEAKPREEREQRGRDQVALLTAQRHAERLVPERRRREQLRRALRADHEHGVEHLDGHERARVLDVAEHRVQHRRHRLAVHGEQLRGVEEEVRLEDVKARLEGGS